MKKAKFIESHPVLSVRDVSKAIEYYTQKLGFSLSFKDGESPRYAGLRRDGVELHLQWHDEKEFDRGDADPPILRIMVDDPDSLFEEYSGAGVMPPEKKVGDTAWGTREFGFFEPDGNGLVFYRDR